MNTLLPAALFSIICATLLSACQQSPEMQQLPRELRTVTTVSNSNGNFKPSADELFSWQEPISVNQTDNSLMPMHHTQLIEQELNNQLSQKGYRIQAEKNLSNYYLRAIVSYSNQTHGNNIQASHGMDAGLGSDSNNDIRGSLLLIISRPSGQVLWQGEVQIFTQANLSDEMRKQNISAALHSMLDILADAN